MSELGYTVPKSRYERELVIRKSRFIGVLDRVRSRAELAALEAECKTLYPGANHYCYAYKAGPPGSSRSIGQSDDGEPHGTAGRPMLNVLLHSELGETGIVVVRYFGGTKLGKGGLARAYADTAKAVLEDAPIMMAVPMQEVSMTLSYAHAARINDWVEANRLEIAEQNFGASVEMTLEVPEDLVTSLEELLLQIGAHQSQFSVSARCS